MQDNYLITNKINIIFMQLQYLTIENNLTNANLIITYCQYPADLGALSLGSQPIALIVLAGAGKPNLYQRTLLN